MTVQTTYLTNSPAAYPGQYHPNELTSIDSYRVQASNTLDFGKAAAQGTLDGDVKTTSAAGDKFVGVVARTSEVVNNGSAGNQTGVDPGELVNVLREGRIHVITSVTVAKEDLLYAVVAAGATRGQFTNVATGNVGPVGKALESGPAGLILAEITQ